VGDRAAHSLQALSKYGLLAVALAHACGTMTVCASPDSVGGIQHSVCAMVDVSVTGAPEVGGEFPALVLVVAALVLLVVGAAMAIVQSTRRRRYAAQYARYYGHMGSEHRRG
jgi:heme/copper-type cytochrome/quinol oxidase subunit 2